MPAQRHAAQTLDEQSAVDRWSFPSEMTILATIKARLRSLLLQRLRWLGAYETLNKIEHLLVGRKIRFETCSICQLACPSCFTAQGTTRQGTVGWGMLKADDFLKFVDNNGPIRAIELSNWGEIFLNPELEKILRIAHAKGIRLEASNGVNLNAADETLLEAVVRYRLRYLSVSIDGATDKTYRIYRRRGSLERVLHNVDRINYYKAIYKSRFPVMTWQFLVFGHNEHEIPVARKMARERGMRFNPIRNLDFEYAPVKDAAFVKQETGIDVDAEPSKVVGKLANRLEFCYQLWDAPQINWDGKVLGCCFNNYSDFGNAFESGLDQCLQGEAYRHTKKVLLGLVEPRPDTPCARCPVYAGIAND